MKFLTVSHSKANAEITRMWYKYYNYANGSCGTFYKLILSTADIGYRPVVTVYKLK